MRGAQLQVSLSHIRHNTEEANLHKVKHASKVWILSSNVTLAVHSKLSLLPYYGSRYFFLVETMKTAPGRGTVEKANAYRETA